ncbi:2353_t:CDS:1 [Diversispora eburnea]|uniref:ADP-ribose 1''-phosphate phosphatase n=2 Tax=Diversisporales TaxID=214509 RepID=A0A9N8V2S4_9GLOM|nr:2353_t:CDS:1 [Diversispora eburnea]CAG8536477.1 5801_t:CDS:1 [Dentiscutata erythropus]
MLKSSESSFTIHERKDDLFEDSNPNDALAICVSQDFRMSRGLPYVFKDRFNGIDELKSQDKRVGQVAYLLHKETDYRDRIIKSRYIFYLIFKEKSIDQPMKVDFENTLKELRKLIEEMKIEGISMPKIATGFDAFNLEYVKQAICKVFEGSNIRITMYTL